MSNKLDVTNKWYGVLTTLGIDREYLENQLSPIRHDVNIILQHLLANKNKG